MQEQLASILRDVQEEILVLEKLFNELRGELINAHVKVIAGREYVYCSYRVGRKVATKYLGVVEPVRLGAKKCPAYILARLFGKKDKRIEVSAIRRRLKQLRQARKYLKRAIYALEA